MKEIVRFRVPDWLLRKIQQQMRDQCDVSVGAGGDKMAASLYPSYVDSPYSASAKVGRPNFSFKRIEEVICRIITPSFFL